MKKFPKTLYVTTPEDEDGDDIGEFFVDTDKESALDNAYEGEEIAIYQLVKIGKMQQKRTLKFEQ